MAITFATKRVGSEMVEYWEKKLRENGVFEDGEKHEVAADVTTSIVAAKRYSDNANRAELDALMESYKNVGEELLSVSDCERNYRHSVQEKIKILRAARVKLGDYVKKIEMLDQFRFPE